ncbi:hypothetical protein [uncultured Methanolobus sp.]|uniref:hypothetical protein n=1 Tax=uncultured Methanolobus sp. TaxID=218300 RepID=UPI0029C7174A|nr:hypothetical protein [uncultured Methanolobus sp.]
MKSVKTWIKTNGSEYGASAKVQNDDDDADYKPILQGLINTRCNYDGAKIEGIME